MAQPHAPTTTYIPVIKTAEESHLIVINDNCILTLDAVLRVAGIGKVLSHRGHELYTLYNAEGGTICEFEGTGLMQRTVSQIEEITKKHGARLKELEDTPRDCRLRLEALERMVDSMWYIPGFPGARQAEDDFAARKASFPAISNGAGDEDQEKTIAEEDELDSTESEEFKGFSDSETFQEDQERSADVTTV